MLLPRINVKRVTTAALEHRRQPPRHPWHNGCHWQSASVEAQSPWQRRGVRTIQAKWYRRWTPTITSLNTYLHKSEHCKKSSMPSSWKRHSQLVSFCRHYCDKTSTCQNSLLHGRRRPTQDESNASYSFLPKIPSLKPEQYDQLEVFSIQHVADRTFT